MKQSQRGMALSGLVVWGGAIALVAVLGMKVVPSVIEYYKILKATKAVAVGVQDGTSVAQVRQAFDRFAHIDQIETIHGSDLEISKDGTRIVIEFRYEKQIHLFGNVSLLIDYAGSNVD